MVDHWLWESVVKSMILLRPSYIKVHPRLVIFYIIWEVLEWPWQWTHLRILNCNLSLFFLASYDLHNFDSSFLLKSIMMGWDSMIMMLQIKPKIVEMRGYVSKDISCRFHVFLIFFPKILLPISLLISDFQISCSFYFSFPPSFK